MIDAREHHERLVTTAARLWAGEAEVVRAYCSLPRSLEQDLFWLSAQAYKEAYPLRVLPEQLGAELLRTGGILSSDGPVVALQLRQEARH